MSRLATDRAPDPEPLTELQHRFIDAFIDHGGRIEAAAIAAGYSPGGAKNIGARNLATPKINDEIVRRIKLSAGTALAIAVGALLRIIETSNDHKAVVSASLGIMDRFGMAVPKGPLVAIQHNTINGTDANALIAEVLRRRADREAAEARSEAA